MNDVKVEDVQIVPKPDNISWKELTDLVRAAYAEKEEKGMSYLATYQDVETTKRRASKGVCLVALMNGELVGTETLKIKKSNKKDWYYGNSCYGYVSQQAVHPKYKGNGIGNKLRLKRTEICIEKKVDGMLGHTSMHAKDILGWWKRCGAQYVDFISSSKTNYYAIRFRIPIHGKKYSSLYTGFRFYTSAVKCILLKNKNGQLRKGWKFLKKIIKH